MLSSFQNKLNSDFVLVYVHGHKLIYFWREGVVRESMATTIHTLSWLFHYFWEHMELRLKKIYTLMCTISLWFGYSVHKEIISLLTHRVDSILFSIDRFKLQLYVTSPSKRVKLG
jgi:hypothetical protein